VLNWVRSLIFMRRRRRSSIYQNLNRSALYFNAQMMLVGKNNPLVSGVNYDKLVEDTEKYRQIHFRAPTGNVHLDTCVCWVQGHVQNEPGEVDSGGDVPGEPRVERVKTTNVIDVFDPKTADSSKEPGTAKQMVKTPVEREPVDVDISGGSLRVRDGYTSTSRLERFIDCWAQHEGDALKLHQITIGGRTLSYRQAVLPPNWIAPAENGTRMVSGGARTSVWPADAPKRLYINFMDKCEKFADNEGGRSLIIDLPLSRIRACTGGTLLLKKIEQAQANGYYLKVYCWGHIVPRDGKAGYVIELALLDNLVLKVVKKQ
jgi:hypothetical protein